MVRSVDTQRCGCCGSWSSMLYRHSENTHGSKVCWACINCLDHNSWWTPVVGGVKTSRVAVEDDDEP